MNCREQVADLREHASGAPLAPALRAHLSGCEACTAVLEAERRLLAEIDAAVGRLLDVDPSPALLVRARALAGTRSGSGFQPSIAWAAAAALVALVVARWAVQQEQMRTAEPPRAAESRIAAPPEVPLATRREPVPVPAPAPRTMPLVRPRVASAEPAVVPPGQDVALRRFAALMWTGSVEAPRGLLEPDSPERPLSPPPELERTVLTIEPIGAASAPPEEIR